MRILNVFFFFGSPRRRPSARCIFSVCSLKDKMSPQTHQKSEIVLRPYSVITLGLLGYWSGVTHNKVGGGWTDFQRVPKPEISTAMNPVPVIFGNESSNKRKTT